LAAPAAEEGEAGDKLGLMLGRLNFAFEDEKMTTVPLHRRKGSDLESVIYDATS
jgi:hypothetical protein